MQIIAFMDTGSGKTLIAVMLVRHFADKYIQAVKAGIPTRRKLVVCLVPTRILVAQQAAVFRRHTNLSVGECFGVSGLDSWGKERWAQELECAPAVAVLLLPLRARLPGCMMTNRTSCIRTGAKRVLLEWASSSAHAVQAVERAIAFFSIAFSQ